MIIGITGTNGAGKGTVVDFLIKTKKFRHYSVSGYLEKELKKRKIEVNRPNLAKIANEIREKKGADYIVSQLFRKAEKQTGNGVIESIRCPSEAKFIKKHQGILIAVDANPKTRYRRITARNSSKDKVSFREFLNQEKSEMENKNSHHQNLKKCLEMADFLIENNHNLPNLYAQIEKIVSQIS